MDAKRSDWKEVGFEHFAERYRSLDAARTAFRCKLPFSPETGGRGSFAVRLLGENYRALYPGFALQPEAGATPPGIAESALVLRYLCEGRWAPWRGAQLSYREVPWGETYFANFEGRCIKRLARMFGDKPEAFRALFEGSPGLRAQKRERQAGYRFEFLSDVFFTFIIWPGDDEFPAQAQILFDDNVPAALSAEDLAVACDIALARFKTRAAAAGG